MNESLRRALLRARLSEEDVAARLEVDPKTVRRWLEGRVPYPRLRWMLAATLGLDEVELWPQLGASRSRPQEVWAIYPHREDITRETWFRLFGHAQERIDILASSALFLAIDPEIMAILADRAAAGVKERICLQEPGVSDVEPRESLGTSPSRIKDALARFDSLCHCDNVEIRVHTIQLNNSIYRSDDDFLITLNVYGIPASRIPVIHLRRARGHEIPESYLESFESIWNNAHIRPI
jgi:transcriptional regulator with XRE-family HTH domain